MIKYGRRLIETKFIGPTNTKGSQIIAKTYGYKVTINYDHALDSDDNHVKAARKVLEVMNKRGSGIDISSDMIYQSSLTGKGFIFIIE